MPYPLSLRGRVFSELKDVESTLQCLEEALRGQRARTLHREGDTIRFRGSFMSRRFGGSVLTVVSWGVLRATRVDALIQVDYSLHFLQNHLVRGGVTLAAFSMIYFGVKTFDPLTTTAIGAVFWILLASLDYLLAVSVFPKFLAAELSEKQG